MTDLINCQACGAVISADDVECKICGTSLGDGFKKRSFKNLPPPPEDSDDTPLVPTNPKLPTPSNPPPAPPKNVQLPRPSQPPLAIPRPSDQPPSPRGDNTKKVPFSSGRVSSSPPPPPPPQGDQPNTNKTLLMMPSPFAVNIDEKVKLPTPEE